MTTVQALLVGGICGFIIGSIAWMLIGLTFGIIADGIPKALNQRIIENKENKNG
tara:strand:+ start:384 stop:545 length:162 start_codon:yes stop_codon:yes gene_type:complete